MIGPWPENFITDWVYEKYILPPLVGISSDSKTGYP